MDVVFCPTGIWALHTISRNRGRDGDGCFLLKWSAKGSAPWLLSCVFPWNGCLSLHKHWVFWRHMVGKCWAGKAGCATRMGEPSWVPEFSLDLSYSGVPVGLGAFVSICTKLPWFLCSLTLTSLGVLGKPFLFLWLTYYFGGMEEGQIIIFFHFVGVLWFGAYWSNEDGIVFSWIYADMG